VNEIIVWNIILFKFEDNKKQTLFELFVNETIVWKRILFKFQDNKKQTLFKKTNKFCLKKTNFNFPNI